MQCLHDALSPAPCGRMPPGKMAGPTFPLTHPHAHKMRWGGMAGPPEFTAEVTTQPDESIAPIVSHNAGPNATVRRERARNHLWYRRAACQTPSGEKISIKSCVQAPQALERTRRPGPLCDLKDKFTPASCARQA